MDATTMTAPVSLAGERVHRLGCTLALDGTVSWAPSGVRGRQPLSCYVIRSDAGAVLIDTGVRAHQPEILAQLEELLTPGAPLAVLLTRTEMDCCLNIPAIEAAFPVDAVYFTGGITVPRSRAEARRVTVEEGAPLRLEPVPGIALDVVAPRARLLPTLWPYDPVSGVLFTSDLFAHARETHDSDPVLVTGVDEAAEAAAVRDQVLVKLRWLTLADRTAVWADLDQIFEDREVHVVAPTHGRMFTGADVVARQRELMLATIRDL